MRIDHMEPTASRRLSIAVAILAVSMIAPQAARAAAGDLDAKFGSSGTVLTDFSGESDYGFAVALQPDGKIVAAGQSGTYPVFHSALARYNRNGSLDQTFGTGGKVVAELDPGGDGLSAIALQEDGKIVAAGSLIENNFPQAFLLARFNADGSLDQTFGDNGRVVTTFGDSTAAGHGVALQRDGKIIVVGVSGAGPYSELNDFAVARYNADGSPDAGFGTGGQVTTHFKGVDNTGSSGNAAVIQSDGKLIVAGSYKNEGTPHELALARYDTDGSLDSTFGTAGKVTTSVGTGDAVALDVALQRDGRIVLAGYSTGPQDHDFELARYNTNGTLDTSFGSGGLVGTNFSGTTSDIASALAIQRDGKLVVGGQSGDYPQIDLAVARYSSTGQLDEGFGIGGKVTTSLGSTDEGLAVALDRGDKIVLAGISFASGVNYDFVVARYLGR